MSGFFNGASGRLAFIAALWALALLTPGSRPSAQGNPWAGASAVSKC